MVDREDLYVCSKCRKEKSKFSQSKISPKYDAFDGFAIDLFVVVMVIITSGLFWLLMDRRKIRSQAKYSPLYRYTKILYK